jgi:hypothetical protein
MVQVPPLHWLCHNRNGVSGLLYPSSSFPDETFFLEITERLPAAQIRSLGWSGAPGAHTT